MENQSNLSARISVNSKAITEVDYIFDSKLLSLASTNGTRYVYSDVPLFVFNGLQNSMSKGKFLNQYVLRKYSFKKV